MTIEQRLIAVATAEVGVREVNLSNTGKKVEEYQAATPLGGTGWPWCAGFVSWCFLTAFGKALCDTVWRRSASCDEILDWGRRHNITSTTPIEGCAGLVMASRNDATHIFLVSAVGDGFVNTREGNTNNSGSRNGDGVYARRRELSERYLYLHWQKLLPASYKLPDGKFVVSEIAKPVVPTPQMWDLYLGGTKADKVPLYDGHAYVPAWKWAAWFGQKVGWDVKMQGVTLNGILVPSQPRLLPDDKGTNRAWLQVTALAKATLQAGGKPLQVATQGGKVLVTK